MIDKDPRKIVRDLLHENLQEADDNVEDTPYPLKPFETKMTKLGWKYDGYDDYEGVGGDIHHEMKFSVPGTNHSTTATYLNGDLRKAFLTHRGPEGTRDGKEGIDLSHPEAHKAITTNWHETV